MSEAIIVALITGSLSLAAVVISNLATARKNATALHTHQAVTDTKIEELTGKCGRTTISPSGCRW